MSEEWERSKENVLPVKRGRSAAGLSDALASSKLAAHSESIEQTRAAYFNRQLELAAGSPLERLNVYEEQFKWNRDHFPSDSSRLIKLLETCTCELKDEEVIKNESRFIKMWIEYADLVRVPADIFAYMNSNKIGEKNALFWMAWAYVAEKASNFKLTDQIYQKGIRKLAAPKELLQKRYQEFQRRLARHYINLAEGGVSEVAEQPRKALGRLSKTQLHGGLRAGDENAPLPLPLPSAAGLKKSAPSKNKGFQVFSDAESATGAGEGLTENAGWRALAPVSATTKENTGVTTKWSEGPLKPARSVRVPQASSAPAFAVFVDEELREEPPAHRPAAPREGKQSLSLRLHFEKDGADPLERHKRSTESERLGSTPEPPAQVVKAATPKASAPAARKGLAFAIYSDSPPQPAPKNPPQLADRGFQVYSDPEPASAALNQTVDAAELNNLLDEMGVRDGDDSTINTRVARKDIDSMFCSPSDDRLSPARGRFRGSLDFSITGFSDIRHESSETDRSIFGSMPTPTLGDGSGGTDDHRHLAGKGRF